MALEKELQSLPPAQWLTRKTIVFDWYDGPREGICALARPSVEFSFELLDERSNPGDLDDRLFRLQELPVGSVDRILTSLAELGPPDQAVWVPVWRFRSEVQQQEADQTIRDILSGAQATSVVIATRDMEHFLGCWPIELNATRDRDWFSALDTSQNQLTG
jgi:hypothetical protein